MQGVAICVIMGSINGKALNGLPIALPNNAAIRAFEKEAAPIDTQIRNNEVESRALVTLRDTLLPKLMSGEIDVSKVDLTQLNSHLYARALHFAPMHSLMHCMLVSGLDMREHLR